MQTTPEMFSSEIFLIYFDKSNEIEDKKLFCDQISGLGERQPETQPINQVAEEHQGTGRFA